MKGKKKKWIRFRHWVVTVLAGCVIGPYCRLHYCVRIEPFRGPKKQAYLILLNHQTPFDQFFVGLSFFKPIYYLATEDIFSLGWISSLIRWLVAPIPIKKQTTDVAAVMTCLRVAREGGSIAIAPEGNRTYSGRTEYMNPAIVPMARKMKLPIALYRIEGGYGTEPRWTDKIRKGKMRAYVAQVIAPEEYSQMTDAQLMEQIEKGLYVDEAVADGCFRSQKRAEYLERAIYVCPWCGLSTFESHGNEFTCKKCGKTVTYGENKTLTGVDCDFPFRFVAQWYDHQKDFVNQLDVLTYREEPMYRDAANLSEVIVYKHKEPLRNDAEVALYGDRIVIDEGSENQLILPFEEVTAISVLGRNKLNVYHNKRVYQFKGSKRFNALKYVNIYYRYKNIMRGDENGEFLGL